MDPNALVKSDQIHQVLGSETVTALAAKAGIAPELASSAIAQLLLDIVDKMMPNGEVPAHISVMEIWAVCYRTSGKVRKLKAQTT